MKLLVKIILLACLVALATSCTKSNVRQLVSNAIAEQPNTEVKYTDVECTVLQQNCVHGEYQEWQTSNKDFGCSCKKGNLSFFNE
jgi:hypothetical protein